MSDPIVTSVSVEDLLKKLRSREWLIPQFQREFVWSVQDVIDFVHSILFSRPIGMATLWAQADNSQLALEPIKLPDKDNYGNDTEIKFCSTTENPKKIYAILDGRQRCTAIAMVFGGFHSRYKRYKHSGRYFLNVTEQDPLNQVVFYKEREVIQKGYDRDATCICDGLFPLSSSNDIEELLAQWMRYLQAIKNKDFYSDGQLPDENELDRRNEILKRAFDGIIKTRLAVYIVPESYNLADVCEIFETLNITGIKVSTVDLVHSWLYSDTSKDAKQILLRDWISDLGQQDGAIGWATSDDRPELTVQIATACYIALENKPEPRLFRGAKKEASEISSVKADDLLRTPTQHWKNIVENDSLLAEFLGDFQRVVASGYFPWTDCPYPLSAAIYVALRYHWYFDPLETHPWGREDLNAVYRAFFWRNALTNRYDQGPLAQLGRDIKEIKSWLNMRQKFVSSSQWASETDKRLAELIEKQTPTKQDLIDYLTDEIPPGALGKALTLPMKAKADKDLVYENTNLAFPASAGVEMHHIYPRGWCQSNKVGVLAILLDKDKAGKDWVNSIANLMPLSRQSNNLWKTKQPGQILSETGINYKHSQAILQASFIDKQCFDYLQQGDKHIKEFWDRRAVLIAEDLLKRMTIII